ncbi:hypothetical protein RRG08_022977 [Elysia crispata]|uniref:S1 motif domain-containing protein n=1 Tax=Elysia crispata TaxID=231223 RepID=A0AAE1AF49_9GAST|nr:hypothetical protein RRG08_022977 [Elysia crispata]
MDVKLVGAAVQYHGEELLHSLTDEQGEQPSSNVTSYLQRWRPLEPEIKDKMFQRNLCGFIARKSDLLFRSLTEEEKNRNRSLEAIDDSFAIMPPLETFMDIPSYSRREEFWKSLRVNDCVTGVVTAIIDQGLRLTLLCIDKGVCRDIEDLNIPAFCPVKELPKLYAKESALDAFQKRDIVRGIVLSIVEETERIIVSIKTESVPDEKTFPRLGLITEDDFPVHYRRQSQISDMSYEEMLQSILGFNNMGNVQSLTQKLQIPTTASYYRFFSRLKIPQKEYAEGLKKWQSQKLAHHSVVQGVEMFKKGDYLEAMQHLNRALQVDAENVEALVARGALYANKENFTSAIKDFEEALLLNPKHSNARNYLIETLLTVGRMCEERRDLEQAVTHYESVLKMDEQHKEAVELLRGCRQLMAFQANPDQTKEKNENEVQKKSEVVGDGDERRPSSSSFLKTSTDKLKALIKEDKERKPRSAKKEKRRQSRSSSSERDSKKGKHRKKKKRRTARSKSTSSGSSSSESGSSDRSSSSRSSSAGRSRKSGRKKKGKNKKRSKKSKRSRKDSSKQRGKSRRESSAEKEVSVSSHKSGQARPEAAVGKEKSRREDDGDEQYREQGMAKYGDNSEEENLKKEELFYHRTAASSFLPVSSHDFFSTCVAIPGLGSPPPPHSVPASISHQEAPKRVSKLRDSPSQGKDSPAHTLRMFKGLDRSGGYLPGKEIPVEPKGLPKAAGSPTEAGIKYRNQSENSWDSSSHVEEAQRHISGSGRISRDQQIEPGEDRMRSDRVDKGGSERTSSKDPHIIRRDDILIAQREKFYKESKEGDTSYKKFRDSRSRSLSSKSSSRSSSGSLTRGNNNKGRNISRRKRRKSRSWTRSRSESPGDHHPQVEKTSKFRLVTGVPELDHYLGGAKTLIKKAMEAKGFSTWEELTAKRDKSKSPSPKTHISKSPSRKKYKSRSPSPKRNKSTSPSSKKYTLKSPSPRKVSSRSPNSKRKSSRSPEPRQVPAVARKTSSRSPLTDDWSSKLASLRMGAVKTDRTKDKFEKSKFKGKDFSSRRVSSFAGGNGKSNSPLASTGKKAMYEEDRKEKVDVSDQTTTSFGKFGPPPRQVAGRETQDAKEVSDVKRSSFQNPEADKRDKQGKEAALHGRGEKSAKGDHFSFMPRILRKPKMDDPGVNKPLVSSNQLEREKKLQKTTRGGEVNSLAKEKNEPSSKTQDEVNAAQGRVSYRHNKEIGETRPRHSGELHGADTDTANNGVELKRPGHNISSGVDGRSKVNRWDQHEKAGKKHPELTDDQDVKRVDIATLSSLQQVATDEVKKSLEEEMEREIERRVRERLQQQESGEGSSGHVKTGAQGSRSSVEKPYSSLWEKRRDRTYHVDSEERQRHKEKNYNISGQKKRYEENDSDSGDKQHSTRIRSDVSRDDDRFKDHGRGRGEVKEGKQGWSEDNLGNTYFAEYGKVLHVGKNYDIHGNVFYAQNDNYKNQGAGVSRSGNYKLRSRSRSKDHSRSRSQSSCSSGSARGSSYRKRKRSKSSEKSQARGNDTKHKGESRGQEKERSQSTSSKLPDNASEQQIDSQLKVSKSEVTRKPEEKDGGKDEATSSTAEGPSVLEKLTKSRWDTESKSRWDDGDDGKQGRSQGRKGDSLTDLEKFLMDLKQQKKKQWIAEGKVKDK